MPTRSLVAAMLALPLAACLPDFPDSAPGAQAAGGASGASAGGSGGESACDACRASSCAQPIEACTNSADCVDVAACLDGCSDAACESSCVAAHPSGAALVSKAFACVCKEDCASACQVECSGLSAPAVCTDGGTAFASCEACQSAVLSDGGCCFSAYDSCWNKSADCKELFTCASDCQADDACRQQCAKDHTASVQLYNAVAKCVLGGDTPASSGCGVICK